MVYESMNEEQATEKAAVETKEAPKEEAPKEEEGSLEAEEEAPKEEEVELEAKEEDSKAEAEEEKAPEFENYELEAVEGSDETLVSRFSEFANEYKIPKDAAESLIKEVVEHQTKAQQEATQAVVDGWKSKSEELFGKDYKATEELAKKAVDRFADPEMREFLEESKLGQEPNILKFLSKVGAAIKKPTVAGGDGSSSGEASDSPSAVLNKLYGNSMAKK